MPDRRERQIVRILAMLRLLEVGRCPSVHQLAAKFRTRRETIYRDLRALEDAGFPITGDERGRLSHPRLLSASRHGLRLSRDELDALRSAAQQSAVAFPDTQALASAVAKLETQVEDKQTGAAGRSQIFESWVRGAKNYRLHEAHIVLLMEAILRQRRCRIEYWKPSALQPKTFDFETYRFLVVDGGLYAIGSVPKYGDVVTLAVDRMLSLTLLPTEFEVSPPFNSDEYRQQAFGVAWNEPMKIVLRFRADQAPYVRERTWHPTQQLVDLPEGGVELTFRAGGPFEIRRWILGWGDAVEVLIPESLREEVARTSQAIAALYG